MEHVSPGADVGLRGKTGEGLLGLREEIIAYEFLICCIFVFVVCFWAHSVFET